MPSELEIFDELLPTERVAIVVRLLFREGQALTSAEIAIRVGLTRRGAWRMMTKLSRVLPIYQDDRDRRWRALLDPDRAGAKP